MKYIMEQGTEIEPLIFFVLINPEHLLFVKLLRSVSCRTLPLTLFIMRFNRSNENQYVEQSPSNTSCQKLQRKYDNYFLVTVIMAKGFE